MEMEMNKEEIYNINGSEIKLSCHKSSANFPKKTFEALEILLELCIN